jgi:hypothetical protein
MEDWPMVTSQNQIREWIHEAQKKGAAFLMIKTDTFDYEDYPVHGFAVDIEAAKQSGSDSGRITEVYDLTIDIEPQLKQHRAFNWPMDPTNADLLQQCQRHFPRLTWHLDDGYEKAFAHCQLAGLRFDFSLTWNGESYGIFASAERHQVFVYYGGTPALALAAAAAHWRELVAEAGAVVGPLPEKPAYKPSPEIQRQSDMGIVAHLMVGERRKDLGLPPDRNAQARAAADAMAWAEKNPE